MERQGELEVGCQDGRVYINGAEESSLLFTPEQAQQLAHLLLRCAEKARRTVN